MTRRMMLAAAPLLILGAAPVHAQDLRDLCADRPGKGSPACTVDPGHLQAELGVGDWTHDRNADIVEDDVILGDLLLRYGLGESTEARVGWTPYGHVRTRDRASGAVDRRSGTGDVTLGLRQNLVSPDGSGFSFALQPFASLPTGGHAIGSGTWGAGLVAPVSYELTDDVQIAFTPEIDAAPDEDRHGRHLAYSGVVGLSFPTVKTVTGLVELWRLHDRDPAGHSTQYSADLSLAWVPQDNGRMQIDAGTYVGLNRETPDVEAYIGVTQKF